MDYRSYTRVVSQGGGMRRWIGLSLDEPLDGMPSVAAWLIVVSLLMGSHKLIDHRFMAGAFIALAFVVFVALPIDLDGSPGVLLPPPTVTSTPAPTPLPTTSAEPLAVAQTTPQGGAGVSPTQPNRPPLVDLDPIENSEIDEELANEIDTLVGEQSGLTGIVVADTNETIQYQRNADVYFQAASLYKLVLLADVYAGIESGAVRPDLELELKPEYFPTANEPVDSYYDETTIGAFIPIDELLFATGAYSSNVAARALLSITDATQLQAAARAIGMEDTFFFTLPSDLPNWPELDMGDATDEMRVQATKLLQEQSAGETPLNITTPRDIATYFSRLLSGQVVNPTTSALILDILQQQVVDDRFPCLLPPDTPMAHKTGNLDHVVHDVGIIWTPAGPAILVAMIENAEDDMRGTQIVQRLALIAYGESEIPQLPGMGTPEAICYLAEPID